MIGYGICIGSQDKFEQFAKPGLGLVLEDDSVVAESSDNDSIFTAYNEMLDHFATLDGLEALVLMHEDVEFRNDKLPTIIRTALADPDVAIVGAIGAVGVKSLSWWEGEGRGRVRETRGTIDFGTGTFAVDMVDGMLLVLSPWAVKNLRFDAENFHGFHGYDGDICFQARAAGKKVMVTDVLLTHHTKGGYGNFVKFTEANDTFRRKWAAMLGITAPADIAPISVDRQCIVCATPVEEVTTFVQYTLLECPNCHTGITNPAPARILESDGIWEDTYGGNAGRLAMRPQWLHEAQLRLDWIHLFASGQSILELGGGTGEFVAVSAQNGWQAYGAEPSEWAAEEGRKLGADVMSTDLDGWIVDRNQEVDVIAAFHVFEHIHEPREFLASVHKALKSGGLLVLEMPNYNAEMARRAPFVWIASNLDDHVFHYMPESLQAIVTEMGFVVEHCQEFTTRVYENAQAWSTTWAKHQAYGCLEPSKDMLRIVARRP